MRDVSTLAGSNVARNQANANCSFSYVMKDKCLSKSNGNEVQSIFTHLIGLLLLCRLRRRRIRRRLYDCGLLLRINIIRSGNWRSCGYCRRWWNNWCRCYARNTWCAWQTGIEGGWCIGLRRLNGRLGDSVIVARCRWIWDYSNRLWRTKQEIIFSVWHPNRDWKKYILGCSGGENGPIVVVKVVSIDDCWIVVWACEFDCDELCKDVRLVFCGCDWWWLNWPAKCVGTVSTTRINIHPSGP